MMDDNFYPCCGYEGLYEWNPQTQEARSLPRNTTKGKVLKWRYNSKERPFVQLCKNGVVRNFYKAMFIYSHFHQCEIPEGYDIHHIDFNHQNNDPSNLLMLSHEEHAKLHAKTKECCQKNNTITSKAVIALDERNRIVHRFASIREAERNGFSQRHVCEACRGYYNCKRDPHCYRGLRWYYEQEWLALQQQQEQPQQQTTTQKLVEPTIRVDADGQMYFFA